MQIHVTSGAPAALRAGALVVPVFSDGRLDGAAQAVDTVLGGAVTELFDAGEIGGKEGEVALLHAPSLATKRVLVVGLGKREFEPQALARYAGTAVRYLGRRKVSSIAFALPLEAQHHARPAAFIIEGALAGTIDSTTYRYSNFLDPKAD